MSSHVGPDNLLPTSGAERNLGLGGTIFLWIAATLVVPTVMTGQMFIPDISAYSAFGIVVFASLIGALILAAVAVIGTRTGLSTFTIARVAYGQKGAKFFAAQNVLILCGWGMIQGYLGGLALNQVMTEAFGFSNILLAIFLTQGLVLSITILGHTGIQRIEGIASTMMVIIAMSVIYSLLKERGLGELESLPLSDKPSLTLAIVFDIVLSTAFSWMALPCDYNRYCKSEKVSFGGITSGYLIGTMIAMGLGILVGSYTLLDGKEPTYDPSSLLGGGLAVAASLVLFLSIVTTNIMNLYSIVMSTMSILPKSKFSVMTLIFGTVCLTGTFIQEALLESFFGWLLVVGALLIPVFAIIVTDYYLVNKAQVDTDAILDANNPRYQYTNGFNIPAIVTYLISAGLAFYITNVAPLDIGGTVVTFAFTCALYLVMVKAFSPATRGQSQSASS